MTYHFTKRLRLPFEAAVGRVTEALKQQGFGILTEIDVQETLKKKLDVDFHPYRILGACNPSLAYQVLQVENKIGTMLPCNVIVQEVALAFNVGGEESAGDALAYYLSTRASTRRGGSGCCREMMVSTQPR